MPQGEFAFGEKSKIRFLADHSNFPAEFSIAQKPGSAGDASSESDDLSAFLQIASNYPDELIYNLIHIYSEVAPQ
jgi:hypothetical protein